MPCLVFFYVFTVLFNQKTVLRNIEENALYTHQKYDIELSTCISQFSQFLNKDSNNRKLKIDIFFNRKTLFFFIITKAPD